jgi:hypothetical protein
MLVGDFILAEGRTGTMRRLLRTSHACMYSIHYSIFDSVRPVPMSTPLPHAQSCSCPVPIPCGRHILFCAAGPTPQVPLSFLHSTFSGSSHHCMSLHSALVHWTADKRLNELLVSPMIENEVVDWLQKSLVFRRRKNDRDIPLHLSKYTRLPYGAATHSGKSTIL